MKKPYVPKRMLTVQLPVDLFDKLEKMAQEQGMTKTALLVKLIKEVWEGAEDVEE